MNTPQQPHPLREASLASIYTYFGAAIGSLNYIVLITRTFSPEQVGFLRLISAAMIVYLKMGYFGLEGTPVRFLTPARKDRKIYDQWGRALFYTCVGGMLLTTAVTAPVLYLKIDKLQIREIHPGLSTVLIIAMFISMFWLQFGQLIQQSAGRTATAAFWMQLLPRLAIMIGAIGVLLKQWSFIFVLLIWSLAHCVGALHINYSNIRLKLSSPIFGSLPEKQEFIRMLRFSFFTFIGTTAIGLQFTIDSLMIASILSIGQLGIYAPMAFAAGMIEIPMRSLKGSYYAYYRSGMAANNIDGTRILFKENTIKQAIICSILFILLVNNSTTIISMMGRTTYYQGLPSLIILSTGIWLASLFGHPTEIITASSKYRLQSYVSLVVLILGIVLNYVLIQILGIAGAALATSVCLLISVLIKSFAIWRYFRITIPFVFTLKLIFLTSLCITSILLCNLTGSFSIAGLIKINLLTIFIFGIGALALNLHANLSIKSPKLRNFLQSVRDKLWT